MGVQLSTVDATERIALITGNEGIQMSLLLDGAGIDILHDGPRHGALCQCDIVDWQSTESTCDILIDLHKNPYAGPIPVF